MVVANHASYLDGVVMAAALPPRFGFVIKREMNDVPVAGLLLRRIGSEFVDRFNRHKGGTDARRVLRTAASGHSLVFFPEGTFTPEVGLGKFHTGAFAIAARAACPVVPAVILGTRRNMPATRVLPRPGPLEVRYGAPIVVDRAGGGRRPGARAARPFARRDPRAVRRAGPPCARATGTDGSICSAKWTAQACR